MYIINMVRGEIHSSLIVSHQSRIRCLMHMYGIGIMPNPEPERSPLEEPLISSERLHEEGGTVVGGGGAKPGQVASFKNAAVLQLVINSAFISVSLVVSGSIDAKEDKPGYTYFIRPEDSKSENVSYSEIPFPEKTIDNIFYPDLGDDTYEFYLVRHGQADHNILKGVDKAFSNKDTSITRTGVDQAAQSGQILSKLINDDMQYKVPTYLFGSDLRRTRQTMFEIIKAFPPLNENSVDDGQKIIILPCAHELTYNPSNGKCDAGQGITPNENISTCTRETCVNDGGVNRTYKPKERFGYNGHPESHSLYTIRKPSKSAGINQYYNNDWSAYYKFYGDATRATRKWIPSCLTCAKGKRCRDTDMIQEAIKSVKIEYDRRNDESRPGSVISSQGSQGVRLSEISRESFSDDESDDDNDSDEESVKTSGGRRRTRVRRVSIARRGRSLKKKVLSKKTKKNRKKTRRLKKNRKKTRRKRRKQ